ncbi:Isoprenylcysteine carboxyl methyltransferase, partial [mine drainage metagenome]
SGPYRHVRHPIYTGILLAFVGSALALAEWRGVLAVLLAAVALIIKLRREERWMLERFGSDYAEYRKASWALLPGLY